MSPSTGGDHGAISQGGVTILARHTESVHTLSGTGRTFWGPGDTVTFLITGEQTGGAYFVSEACVPPGGGPPPHIHHREAETFYILEGEVRFRVGDNTLTASAGDFVSAPRDTPHSFKNEGGRLAKMIVTCVPAGMERFFEEAFYPAP